MTPADIERMARDAGMHNDGQWWFDGDSNAQCDVSTAALTRFAALVRAQALDEAQQLVQANALACADGSMLQVYLASNAAAIRALGDTK